VIDVLLLVGLAVAGFVGITIGGSSTGVAFGPAVGSGTVSKLTAAALMTGFAFLGGITWGKNVIRTISVRVVPQSVYSLEAAVGVLLFVGVALLLSNLFGVPASTSMTAVGAVAGLGAASGTLRWDVLGRIVVWWVVAPILAFWLCAVIGRYLYPHLSARVDFGESDGPLLRVRREGVLPRVARRPGTTRRELVGNALVVVVACYMAFSAGASNVANAVAPLIGNDAVGMNAGIVLASVAIGIGAFTLARRTLETVGNDLTDLPILAALIVEVVSATLITALAGLGIPASLAVSATMCIVGLGWGRATRQVTLRAAVAQGAGGGVPEPVSGDGGENTMVPAVGESDPDAISAGDLFDPGSTAWVVALWTLTPSLAAVASFFLFRYVLVV
jgi:PiT family inorganic phosphate transporter